MKKLYTTIILLAFIGLSVYGQQDKKCKCSDKVDEFTKERIISTSGQSLFDNTGKALMAAIFADEQIKSELFVIARYDNGKRYLFFELYETGNNNEDFDGLEVLLSNDSIVQFFKPSNKGYEFEDGTATYWKFYRITDSDWDMLKNYPVKKLRLHLKNNTIKTIQIDDKFINSISNVIKCIDYYDLPIEHYNGETE